MSHDSLLNVDQVVKRFGGFTALNGVSLSLKKGEILGLVGPNGSGKTTCINVISGLYSPDGGEVSFHGRSIAHVPMFRRALLGINRTFQIPKPFKALTVRENVEVAGSYVGQRRRVVDDPIDFVGLSAFADGSASSLTSGQQKMLDLARALSTGPELLLVDELAAGLNPQELDTVAKKLTFLASQGVAMIVVEHLLGFVNQLTEHVIVMNEGREIFEGTLSAAAKDPQVVAVYLGQSEVNARDDRH